MKKNLPGIALAFLLLLGCGNADNKNAADYKQPANDKEGQRASSAASGSSGTRIRNNIDLKVKDLQVSQAFLMYDDGKLVPESNQAAVGQPVRLRLVVDGGWKDNNGSVSLGASERIETNDGQVVVDEKDMFASVPNISVQDAKFITLTATISQMDKLYDYFLVSCRVWDKNGPGEINASYRLYIQ
jgi:hypothetical protein